MKFIAALTILFCLVSCNTTIGAWRDSKAGFNWTKNKIQNSGGGGGQEYEYGAPVY